MEPKQNHRLTKNEYFDIERTSEIRHEFIDGELFAMAGATRNHDRLVDKIREILKTKSGCTAFAGNTRVEVDFGNGYRYPDLLLVCDKPEGDPYSVNNPLLIVEVLSENKDIDLGRKFGEYRRIPSLMHYMVVDQYKVFVEHYFRQGSTWVINPTYSKRSDRFVVEGIAFSLHDIYSVVDWEDR